MVGGYGVLAGLSFLFEWDVFGRYDENEFFGDGGFGGASNLPIFFGLMALAGALLISKNEKDNKK